MKKIILNKELDTMSYIFMKTAIDTSFQEALDEKDEETKIEKIRLIDPYVLRFIVLEIFANIITLVTIYLSYIMCMEFIKNGKYIFLFPVFLILPTLFTTARKQNVFKVFRLFICFLIILAFFDISSLYGQIFLGINVLIFVYLILFNSLVTRTARNNKLFLTAIKKFSEMESLKEIQK